MPPEAPVLISLKEALTQFAFPPANVQTSKHIIPLHWYVACRLVIEGGFHPDHIFPRPPITVKRGKGGLLLHHDPSAAEPGERTVLGGLKTKKLDVTVTIPTIGPVLAVSLKGTQRAFRNLTNRMEEAAGDCTNLHMAYPALVYAFWSVLRANEADDPIPVAHFQLKDGRYAVPDRTFLSGGELAEPIERYRQALLRLSERDDLRDHPSRYEACGLTFVKARGGPAECGVYAGHAHPKLDYNRMFQRLYAIFDRRFVYTAATLRSRTRRKVWHRESPLLRDTILRQDAFAEMEPRVG
ncbi:MAG: hypothetical protein F4Y20_02815 [Acidobacteria bacterium]|nr:hypothetical protein [Acidobacteriota bacterium]MYH22664.1 hypothetical protein [Acidobacteriota bacterium]MYK79832.1 hypothetical protein [Acidobacteriota bacterium]